MALRSSVTCSPSCMMGASLERTLPPAWPSVVDEAINSWSAAMRPQNAFQRRDVALEMTHVTHAILIWCIA